MNHTSSRTLPSALALFIISVSVLHLELVQMRIFSLALWHHLAYMVITIAMLGFGAAGTIVAVKPEWFLKKKEKTLAAYAILFAVLMFAAFILTAKARLDTFQLFTPSGIQYEQLILLFGYYAVFLAPFICAGIVVTVLFSADAGKSFSLYAVNLTGSATGVVLFAYTFGWIGGERSILLGCGLAAAAGFVFSIGTRSKLLMFLSLAVTIIFGCIGIQYPGILEPVPAPSKAYGMYLDTLHDFKRVYSEWNTISRIDVIASNENLLPWMPDDEPYAPHMAITIDGDATTWMWNFGTEPARVCGIETDLYSAAYLTKTQPEVLVIGLGGGNDIRTALHYRAKTVTGVELNPIIAKLPERIFPDFVDNIYSYPGVEINVSEGRSFIRRSHRTYDIIQMSGVDTWSGLSSGSYVLSENYLYTTDAFQDYLSHLKPDGVLAINRWLFDPPREMLRMTAVGAETLRQLGAEKPWNHILVLAEQYFCSTLFKRTPWTQKEIAAYSWYDKTHDKFELKYSPGTRKENPFSQLMKAFKEGTEEEFYDEYLYQIRPVTDNNPFFFDYYKWKNLSGQLFSSGTGGQIGANWPIAFTILSALMVQVTVLVAVFIGYPLMKFHQKGMRLQLAVQSVSYFVCLGIGYMFFEIVMMQKLVLYLGHPTQSISVVMAGLLFFSGFGSLVASKFISNTPRHLPVLLLLAFGAIIATGLIIPVIVAHTLQWQLSGRVAITLGLLAIPSILMGMPFPAGLKLIGLRLPNIIPWAWGANGGASVLASVGAILIAMNFGFSTVFYAGAFMYLLAYGFFLWFEASFK